MSKKSKNIPTVPSREGWQRFCSTGGCQSGDTEHEGLWGQPANQQAVSIVLLSYLKNPPQDAPALDAATGDNMKTKAKAQAGQDTQDREA